MPHSWAAMLQSLDLLLLLPPLPPLLKAQRMAAAVLRTRLPSMNATWRGSCSTVLLEAAAVARTKRRMGQRSRLMLLLAMPPGLRRRQLTRTAATKTPAMAWQI